MRRNSIVCNVLNLYQILYLQLYHLQSTLQQKDGKAGTPTDNKLQPEPKKR